MVHVLIRQKVADYYRWRPAFDRMFRHDFTGEHNCRVFHSPEDVNDLTLFLDWDDLDRARQFITSKEMDDWMKQAGVIGTPEVCYLSELHPWRRSAAD